jgi:predicted RNA-binding protein YlxR (DUF448 family)
MDLIRLTVDFATQRVMVNDKTHRAHGRSAYLCRVKACVNQALKGTRLKFALNGRAVKGVPTKRSIKWPLEEQVISDLLGMCPEAEKTCQNTESKEDRA